jgi:uncharacterized protein YcaQ
MTLPVLKNPAARRLFLHRHGLGTAPSGPATGAALAQVIHDLGFVQVDSVNTLARAHDLILWSRRQSYRPEALSRLAARRQVFEHWTHDAAVIPVEYFPHWRLRFVRAEARMRERWPKWQGEDFLHRFDGVLKHVADNGECLSSDLAEGEGRGTTGWWDWHPSKAALEFLWLTGQLSITRREGFRKVYDLTERVIPAEHLSRRPDDAESVDWFCHQALDRLGFATGGEIAAFWAHVTPDEAKAWVAQELAAGRIEEVAVEGNDGRLRKSVARPGLLDQAAALPPAPERVRVLSPFDPALRDRNRAERLFGFFYRIEIFVPAGKRQYGYYVFPVLEGETVIGRIDMARDGETLAVRAFWPEAGVRMGKGRLGRLQAELERTAVMAGCSRIDLAADWLR